MIALVQPECAARVTHQNFQLQRFAIRAQYGAAHQQIRKLSIVGHDPDSTPATLLGKYLGELRRHKGGFGFAHLGVDLFLVFDSADARIQYDDANIEQLCFWRERRGSIEYGYGGRLDGLRHAARE